MLSLHVGGCGINMGNAFWEKLCAEHGIDEHGNFIGSSDAQLARVQSFFHESVTGSYVPRAVFVDLEGSLASPVAPMHSLDSVVLAGSSSSGAGNNFARGIGGDGFEVVQPCVERLRQWAEGCEEGVHGVMMTHALAGGTGSGLGSLLAQETFDMFRGAVHMSVPVLPPSSIATSSSSLGRRHTYQQQQQREEIDVVTSSSSSKSALPSASSAVVEPYNTVLSLHRLVSEGHSRIIFPLDQGCLVSSSHSLKHANALAARVISSITCPFRFRSSLNSSLRKMATNLVPYPRLRFVSVSAAPFDTSTSNVRPTVPSLVSQVFLPSCSASGMDLQQGRYLCAYLQLRGRMSEAELEQQCADLRDKKSSSFLDWIPDSLQASVVQDVAQNTSACLLSNTTAIGGVLTKHLDRFKKMLSRKAFLHLYHAEGCSIEEFKEAEEGMRSIVDDYRQCHDSKDEDLELPSMSSLSMLPNETF